MDESFPMVSIVVPVYDVQEYVGKCLESIIGQSYTNLEIIVVDDGSTDSSGKICDEYANLDRRIVVVHTENKGLVAARKLGIQLSKGDYIGFVDGDDYIDQDMYRNLVENIHDSEADFVHSGFIEEDNGISKVVSGIVNNEKYEISTENAKITFLNEFVFCTKQGKIISPSIWSKLFKKEFIKKVYFLVPDKNSYGEDLICLVLSCVFANRVSLYKGNDYHYVKRKKSLTDIHDIEYLSKEVRLYEELLRITRKYFNSENLNKQLVSSYKNKVFDIAESFVTYPLRIPRFFWRDISGLFGKKIILYGAGKVGLDYYLQICRYPQCNIVSWVDKDYLSITYEFSKIESIDVALGLEFDVILIAIRDETIVNSVIDYLHLRGIEKSRIMWNEPGEVLDCT